MTTHQMKLAVVPFGKVANGTKTIESRLYDEKRQQIKLGDRIEFICKDNPTKKVTTIVKALYLYPDFVSMFSDFSPPYFGGVLKEEILKEIEAFYSKDEQAKYGVVGIKIESVR